MLSLICICSLVLDPGEDEESSLGAIAGLELESGGQDRGVQAIVPALSVGLALVKVIRTLAHVCADGALSRRILASLPVMIKGMEFICLVLRGDSPFLMGWSVLLWFTGRQAVAVALCPLIRPIVEACCA